MGEIRSTLDIIMERTRGLTMSEEERRRTLMEEISAKVKGMVQRHLDAALGMEAFEAQFLEIRRKGPEMADAALRRECLERMDPEKDNTAMLQLLSRFRLCDTGRISELIAEGVSGIKRKREQRRLALLRGLGEKGISGSALVPNLEADEVWEGWRLEVKGALRKALEAFY
jgi:hypothetical protein